MEANNLVGVGVDPSQPLGKRCFRGQPLLKVPEQVGFPGNLRKGDRKRILAINILSPEVTKSALGAIGRMKNELRRGKPCCEHEPFGQSLGQSWISTKVRPIFDEAWPPSLARHQTQIPKLLILGVADSPLAAQFLLMDRFERARIREILDHFQ